MAAQEAAPHLAEFAAMLVPRLPLRPLASQSLKCDIPNPGSATDLLSTAIAFPWLALNTPQAINCLAWDIDHQDGIELIAALPASIRPTLVIDPLTLRSHAFIPLATPVWTALAPETEDGKPAPAGKFARVGPTIIADLAERLMRAHLRAGKMNQAALVKNPFGLAAEFIAPLKRRPDEPKTSPMLEAHIESRSPLAWRTIVGAGPCELRDIVNCLADEYGDIASRPAKNWWKKQRGEPDQRGRNCAVFDLTRWWAYDHLERDGGAIAAEALRINSGFPVPLPAGEVHALARSIGRFMNSRYNPAAGLGRGQGIKRLAATEMTATQKRRRAARRTTGVMGLAGSAFDLTTKRRLAGKRSADINSSKTDERLASAIAAFPLGRRVTQAAIAEASGVSLRTVRSRWPELLATGKTVPLSGSSPPGLPEAKPTFTPARETLRSVAVSPALDVSPACTLTPAVSPALARRRAAARARRLACEERKRAVAEMARTGDLAGYRELNRTLAEVWHCREVEALERGADPRNVRGARAAQFRSVARTWREYRQQPALI